MTNLSDLFPAGAGKQVSFVASGTLSNGQTVALKTDGTVEAVGVTGGVGTPAIFEAAVSYYNEATFDSNANKVVIAYSDAGNSNYGTAIVGTVSGTSISFGTPVVFATLNAQDMALTFDSSANKVVIIYKGASSHGTAIVGTVSGTSISFGADNVFNSANSFEIGVTFDSNANKVVLTYVDAGNSYYGTSIVATVSGTSISFGTAVVFSAASSAFTSIIFDSSANKVVINWRGNSSYGTAIVGTVSGTSISFGTAVVYSAASTYYSATAFDSTSNKVVIAYRDGGNSNYGTAIVGTVSSTSISFGTPVVFEAARSEYIVVTFDSSANKVVIAYADYANSNYGTVIVGTVSGTSISFDSPVVFSASNPTVPGSAIFDSSANKVVIAYRPSSNYGTSVTFSPPASNNTSFIGITDAAISSAASGNVTIKGGIAINGLSSLTPGSDYYAQADGTISTVSTSPAVKIGKAMSATSINLEYQS